MSTLDAYQQIEVHVGCLIEARRRKMLRWAHITRSIGGVFRALTGR